MLRCCKQGVALGYKHEYKSGGSSANRPAGAVPALVNIVKYDSLFNGDT